VNQRFDFDRAIVGAGAVTGADEAGRGCLAGPLVAAAVCFDYAVLDEADFDALDDLDDSKKLTKARRADLYVEVLRRARQVSVVFCSAGTIDRDGLHRSNLSSLAVAVTAIAPVPDVTLVDGFALRGCARPHRAVVGGDGRSAAIAAASVVAKVARDRLMLRLHARYPQYGFDRHVGYATAMHRDAIASHGVCPLHRLSFSSAAYLRLSPGSGPTGSSADRGW
jgi:ribonuclease HII